jgi:hypothetical protein
MACMRGLPGGACAASWGSTDACRPAWGGVRPCTGVAQARGEEQCPARRRREGRRAGPVSARAALGRYYACPVHGRTPPHAGRQASVDPHDAAHAAACTGPGRGAGPRSAPADPAAHRRMPPGEGTRPAPARSYERIVDVIAHAPPGRALPVCVAGVGDRYALYGGLGAIRLPPSSPYGRSLLASRRGRPPSSVLFLVPVGLPVRGPPREAPPSSG